MAGADDKAAGAFRTIGEVSAETGLAQHVLRYWETRFESLKPLQRAGNRRYYRPEDVALVKRINTLLNDDGYTIRGVQQLLASEKSGGPVPVQTSSNVSALRQVRDMMVRALATDRV